MKTNLIISNGHYLKPIREAVCVGAVGGGDDIDELLGDGYVDIFTDELFGKFGMNYIHAVSTWSQTWKIDSRRATKKDRRNARIDAISGIHWNMDTGLKEHGKNRKLRRLMLPSPEQIQEFNDYLPF